MKVSELIKALEEMPQDKPVIIEGCDCFGNASEVAELVNKVAIYRD